MADPLRGFLKSFGRSAKQVWRAARIDGGGYHQNKPKPERVGLRMSRPAPALTDPMAFLGHPARGRRR